MSHLATFKKSLLNSPLGWSLSLMLGLGLTISLGHIVRAESPATAPQELKQVLSQLEAAANSQDIEKLMQFYSPNFTNSDGLKYNYLAEALKKTWERYPQLTYKTELKSWEKVGNELVAETITYIQGNNNTGDKSRKLNSTIRSRQYFQGQKLVRQEILAEKTQLMSGNTPPEVTVNIPEKVRVGQQFDFDVIVKEPLNKDILLGTAIEEEVKGETYLNPTTLELDMLPGGGIFKIAKAPLLPENIWLSAVLVRGDGMTLVTQRVRVEK